MASQPESKPELIVNQSAGQFQAEIKVLAVVENAANTQRGYGASQSLQCFTGGANGVVGVLRNYDLEHPVVPGDYLCTFGWSNREGRLEARINKMERIRIA